jgi:Mg2+/Co2+ transporter CorB
MTVDGRNTATCAVDVSMSVSRASAPRLFFARNIYPNEGGRKIMNRYDYLYISALVILLVLSGFFSASDMAYSSVNILRLEHRSRNGDKKAKKVLKHVKDYDHTIASILFSNDFVNILASSLASLLGRDILTQYVGVEFASMISSVTFFFLVLIIGEITPKAFAKTHSYSLAIHLRNFLSKIY